MADPEITGSKDLLRSFFYLYDKSEKFRELFNDPEWKNRNFKKIELIWRNGPRNPYAPNSYAASSRLVGDGPDRIWRIEVNWNLMGRISDDNVANSELNHNRTVTLEETIAHEVAHALFPSRSYGDFLSKIREREGAVIDIVNGIRRDLRLRERQIKDPKKDLRFHYKKPKHYNEPWVEGVYTKEENIRRTTGWRAHPVLAPANYESKLWKRRGEGGDSKEAQPETRPKSTTLRGQEPVSEPPRLQLDPTVHRLLSGDLSALDPENGPFSPNLLRMLMGGNVPRVKGATRLHDIARPPANRVGR